MQIRTAGELRGFLTEVLSGIRDGSIDGNKANAIAKVAAQINASLAAEVQAAVVSAKMGEGRHKPGELVIASHAAEPALIEHVAPVPDPVPAPALKPKPTLEDATIAFAARKRTDGRTWCEQCDMAVSPAVANNCKSAFCKVRAEA